MSVDFRAVRYVNDRPVAVDLGNLEMNLANGNAALLCAAFGIEPPNEPYMGSLTIPEARRALIRARNTEPELRPASDTKRPGFCRVIVQGVDAERMASYLTRFERLVEAAAAAGADRIEWA